MPHIQGQTYPLASGAIATVVRAYNRDTFEFIGSDSINLGQSYSIPVPTTGLYVVTMAVVGSESKTPWAWDNVTAV